MTYSYINATLNKISISVLGCRVHQIAFPDDVVQGASTLVLGEEHQANGK